MDEERLAKARKTTDTLLKRIGNYFGKALSLDSNGIAYLSYEKVRNCA